MLVKKRQRFRRDRTLRQLRGSHIENHNRTSAPAGSIGKGPHHATDAHCCYDGDTFKREQLMDRYGIQINKTSRNSVLFMTNIGTTRSSVAFLVEVLVSIAAELDQAISEMSLGEREHFEQAVWGLTERPVQLCNFSGFHPAFRDHSGSEPTPEGDVRSAFYLSYDDTNCEYLMGEQIDEKLDAGIDVVSATYVTPYPP
ncbi:MAG: hypothetical protein QOE48_2591, partial [Mycobacterium sp.]|nr:hypothetical protein [Mycobacterium sp.]